MSIMKAQNFYSLPLSMEIKEDGKPAKKPTISGWSKDGRGCPEVCKLKKIKNLVGDCALLTGEANGITVIDVDVKDKGREAMDGIIEVATINTPRATTPSGGYHLYFKYSPKLNNASKVITTAGQKRGIDIRNDGGYIIVPPTEGYHWKNHPDTTELQEIPEEIIQKFNARAYHHKTEDNIIQKKEKTPKKQQVNLFRGGRQPRRMVRHWRVLV